MVCLSFRRTLVSKWNNTFYYPPVKLYDSTTTETLNYTAQSEIQGEGNNKDGISIEDFFTLLIEMSFLHI